MARAPRPWSARAVVGASSERLRLRLRTARTAACSTLCLCCPPQQCPSSAPAPRQGASAGPVQLGTPRAGPSYCGTPAQASGARASPIRIVVLLNVVTLPLPRSLRTASVLRVIMQVPSHAMATVTLPLQVPSHAMATCLRTGEAQRDTMVKVLVLSSLQ